MEDIDGHDIERLRDAARVSARVSGDGADGWVSRPRETDLFMRTTPTWMVRVGSERLKSDIVKNSVILINLMFFLSCLFQF